MSFVKWRLGKSNITTVMQVIFIAAIFAFCDIHDHSIPLIIECQHQNEITKKFLNIYIHHTRPVSTRYKGADYVRTSGSKDTGPDKLDNLAVCEQQ